MRRYLIHTTGDLILVMGVDGRPRAYEVEADGSLTEKDAALATALRETPDSAAIDPDSGVNRPNAETEL